MDVARKKINKMASEITFVGEEDIEFISSVSIPNLQEALVENFLEYISESEDDLSELNAEWTDFSDQSSGQDDSEMSCEESPEQSQAGRQKVCQRKKVPKVANKKGDASSTTKKKAARKYISTEEVKRLEVTLKSCALNVQTLCEDELKNDISLSSFPLRKKIVSTILNREPVREMFGKFCQDMFSQIISTFTEVSSSRKLKNSEKRASFSIKCSQALLIAEEWEIWQNIKEKITTSNKENEREEVHFHIAVLMNTTYWTLYEKFLNTVMQGKIDSDETRIQPIASEDAKTCTVVDSDFVDVARVSGAALHELRRGKEKIIQGRKGAKKVSEATKGCYATEVILMAEMACSENEKNSLPLGLKTLDEGKLTFFKSKFSTVLLLLDKRIREMLNEENQKRYPKHLMKLTKQAISLDEELCESFLAAAKTVCTSPVDDVRIRSIWQGLVKKICHTRFKEFYSVQEEKKLIQEGKVVSADQSLRDKLKTYSVDKRA